MIDFILKFLVFVFSLHTSIKLTHLYQLKDYNALRYLKSIAHILILLSTVFFTLFVVQFFSPLNVYILTCSLLLCHFLLNFILPKSKKTPLVITNKIKRTIFIQVIILFVSIFSIYSFILYEIILCLSPVISNTLNIYDKLKNKKYIRLAQQRIKSMNVKIIAITGSNGKTSVKNILTSFLNLKYTTIATPASFNTPLGIAKFINNIDKNVEIVVLEFGARRIGDIKKLCQLFTPDYGIITMVGDQHLATFKTYKNILQTKKELSDFLHDKPCVYNLDNLGTNSMFQTKQGAKAGISLHENSSDIFAKNISIKSCETHFDLCNNKKLYHCKTKLLGKHNITNILLAYSMAKIFDIDDEKIIDEIYKIEQTPHRLSLIVTDIYILDDTYNCSLSSASESLAVLSQMPNKKMVVTPGIIEGGKYEYSINKTLGQKLSKFDYVVIVGKHNKDSILSGLKENKYNKKILLANTIEDAKQYFKLLNKFDTLLLLNDLPDDYN